MLNRFKAISPHTGTSGSNPTPTPQTPHRSSGHNEPAVGGNAALAPGAAGFTVVAAALVGRIQSTGPEVVDRLETTLRL
jgi:hypothetical protein